MKNLPKTVGAWIFYLSLLYYVFWILYAVISMFIGIDSGWAMPAMSSHNKDYGILAFASTIGMGMLYTATIFWFIPLYQILYLIASGIVKAFKNGAKRIIMPIEGR